MAINLALEYPGKTTIPSPDYPYGGGRNVTTPGDGTGTPWEKALLNDILGFQQAILLRADVVPTGSSETAQTSQYLDGVVSIATVLNLAIKHTFTTVAAFKASLLEFPDGKIIHLLDRSADFIKATGTGSGNDENIIDSDNTDSNITITETETPYQLGYDGTDGTTSTFQSWLDFSPSSVSGSYLLGGGVDTRLDFSGNSIISNLVVNDVRYDSNFVGGKLSRIPIDFPFKFNAVALAVSYGSVKLLGFDANQYDFTRNPSITITKVYVDNINGDNLDDGLTPATPVRSVSKGLDIIIAGAFAYSELLLKGGYYYDVDSWSSREPVTNLVVRQWFDGVDARDIERPVLSTEQSGLSWSLVSGNVWSALRSAVTFVIDGNNLNGYGDFTSYVKVNSVSECEALEGSFYASASTIYVHRIGGGTPDSTIHPLLKKANGGVGDGAYTFYMEGVDFWGGSLGWSADSRPAGTSETVVLKDCKSFYSFANGFEFYGIDLAITQDCVSAYTGSDGFNYHSNRDTLTQVTKSVELNCVAYELGVNALGIVDINNGSTAHDFHQIIRMGCSYQNAQGPVVADVNSATGYNFCISARDSTRIGETPSKASFLISSDQDSWLDNSSCTGTLYSLAVSGGGTLHCQNISIDKSVRGLESISSY